MQIFYLGRINLSVISLKYGKKPIYLNRRNTRYALKISTDLLNTSIM